MHLLRSDCAVGLVSSTRSCKLCFVGAPLSVGWKGKPSLETQLFFKVCGLKSHETSVEVEKPVFIYCKMIFSLNEPYSEYFPPICGIKAMWKPPASSEKEEVSLGTDRITCQMFEVPLVSSQILICMVFAECTLGM